ncbi:MAG: hypothetical protein ACFBWO_03760 [Paracoccaceae bacterium]
MSVPASARGTAPRPFRPRLARGSELAERDPVHEPARDKRSEVKWTLAILGLWFGWAVLTFSVAGIGQGRTVVPIPFMLMAGIACWWGAERLVRDRGMVWPGSMLGLLGGASFALALSLATPGLRALPGLEYVTVIYSGTTLGMMVFAWRFRLAGLISPIVTFSVISLFLVFKGTDPEGWRAIEGISPRGFLAAFIDNPTNMAVFGTLAALAMWRARWLDLYGDWHALQAARPLHIIGAAIVALVAGRLAELLPTGATVTVLAVLYVAGFLWAMRIDRLPVLVAIWLAMARPLVDALAVLTRSDLAWWETGSAITIVTASGMVLWGWTRQRVFVPIGWTLQPRHILRNWPERVIWPYRPEREAD